MTDTLYRYPGAQPFRDDEFSRRTFFGREPASVALTDQILANRLVVVYAKSGLGKTSLLNAGVAPRLREAASLPLFVRVNDIQRGPLTSVLDGIRMEAERQQVEYVQGESSSLWSFFKSVEFWRGDLLLTPVLILDQFEELFTLQSEEARETFLSELGFLVRGVPPPSLPQIDSNVSNAPPSVRVVLSLREDFLGILEEASDRIPQIMDHRFRLAPFTCETAEKAITGPAAIDDPDIATKPFRLEPEFVTSILDYLSKSTAGARGPGSRYVEPFHLQLICQRVEKIVAFKQKVSSEEIVVSSKDLGGEAALAKTLVSFYTDAIRSLPSRHLRGAIRLLCEQFLISPEGRRLSLEERELQRQLRLPHDTLSQLVERRLLRTDRRSDSTYYELSHDALVQPVLASRRTQALVVGWAAVVGGSIFSLGAAALIAATIAFAFSHENERSLASSLAIVMLVAVALLVGFPGIVWLRAGIRTRKRYRRHAPSELTEPLPTLLPLKDRVLAWILLVAGSSLFALWGLAFLYALIMVGTLPFTHDQFPHWLAWAKHDKDALDAWQQMHDRPFVEIPWNLVQYPTIIVFGWMLLRRGARKLWPDEFASRSKASPVSGLDHAPSLVLASLKMLSGGIAFVAAALGFFTLGKCVSVWHGTVPYRLLQAIVSSAVLDACKAFYRKDYSDLDAVSVVLFLVSAVIFSIALLRGGVLDVRSVLQHRRFTRLARGRVHAQVAAVVCGILIVALLLYWAWPRVPSSTQTGEAQEPQAQAETSNPQSVTSRSVWAVGKGGSILHTQDGGSTWKTEPSSSTVQLNFVAFATPQSGWAVGNDGTILHTENGGSTWKREPSSTTAQLNSVAFVTPQLGWAVGNDAPILHTEDGGSTWKAQVSGTASLSSIAFTSPELGWVVGHGGLIGHTEDGGRTWKRQTSGTDVRLNSATFVTSQSAWVVGEKGTILHSEDGGRTWNLEVSNTLRDLFGVAFVTLQSGWVVGEKGTILHTEDGGRTWKRHTSVTRADVIGVAFATPQSGWAVGDDGTVLHTEDGGGMWKAQTGGTFVDLKSIAIAKPRGAIEVEFNTVPNPSVTGVLVVSRTIARVVPDGSADKAGLKTGDMIVSVNGKAVKTGDELQAEISSLKPGSTAKLGYVRNGKDITANVTIADRAKPFAGRTER